jgi:hypothetical protein
MVAGDDTVRVTVSGAGVEQIVTFFLRQDGAVRHELAFGGVSELTLLDGAAAAGAVAGAVAEAVTASEQGGDGRLPAEVGAESVGRLAVTQLHAARSHAADGGAAAGEVAAQLAGLREDAAVAIAAVMGDPAARWITVLRIVTREGGKAEADHGFFAVDAAGAGWLFDMTGRGAGAGAADGGDANAAVVYPLARSTALAAAARLLAEA